MKDKPQNESGSKSTTAGSVIPQSSIEWATRHGWTEEGWRRVDERIRENREIMSTFAPKNVDR